jgi:hypothetical protein
MTIGRKLTASSAAMLALSLLLGMYALKAITDLSESLDTAINKTTKKIELVNALSVDRSDLLAAQRGIVMFTFGKSDAGVESAKRQFESAAGRWSAALSELRPLLVSDEAKQLTNELDTKLAAWRTVIGEIAAQRFWEARRGSESWRGARITNLRNGWKGLR